MTHPHLPILTAHGNEAFLQAFQRAMQSDDPDGILSTLWNEYHRLKIANNSKISLRIWIAQAIDRNNHPEIPVIYRTPLQIDWSFIINHPEWSKAIKTITREATILLNNALTHDESFRCKPDEYRDYSIYPDCAIAPTALASSPRMLEDYKF